MSSIYLRTLYLHNLWPGFISSLGSLTKDIATPTCVEYCLQTIDLNIYGRSTMCCSGHHFQSIQRICVVKEKLGHPRSKELLYFALTITTFLHLQPRS